MEASSTDSFFDPQISRKVDDLRETIAKNAEDIIKTSLPQKILHLTQLYESTFTLPLEQVSAAGGVDNLSTPTSVTKKRKLHIPLDDETAKVSEDKHASNHHVQAVITVLKSEVLQSIDFLNSVKLWIQLNIPRIEDGNNFGVGIQEETIAELTRSEDAGYNLLESMTKYYVTRGKLVTRVMKWPGVEDYRQSVRELDQKEYINLKLSCLDMRNNLAIVYDMLTKNIDKITKPRTSHSHSLY